MWNENVAWFLRSTLLDYCGKNILTVQFGNDVLCAYPANRWLCDNHVDYKLAPIFQYVEQHKGVMGARHHFSCPNTLIHWKMFAFWEAVIYAFDHTR